MYVKILKLLENNARMSEASIAAAVGITEKEVKEELGFVVFAEGKQSKTCIQTSRVYS